MVVHVYRQTGNRADLRQALEPHLDFSIDQPFLTDGTLQRHRGVFRS